MRNIFLNIEAKARKYFEPFPFIHAFLAGVGVILFWRGAWELADIYQLDPILSVVVGVIILGGIGLFVQTFVGNAIIIKNVNNEIKLEKSNKQQAEKFQTEIVKEEITLEHLSNKLDIVMNKLQELEKKN